MLRFGERVVQAGGDEASWVGELEVNLRRGHTGVTEQVPQGEQRVVQTPVAGDLLSARPHLDPLDASRRLVNQEPQRGHSEAVAQDVRRDLREVRVQSAAPLRRPREYGVPAGHWSTRIASRVAQEQQGRCAIGQHKPLAVADSQVRPPDPFAVDDPSIAIMAVHTEGALGPPRGLDQRPLGPNVAVKPGQHTGRHPHGSPLASLGDPRGQLHRHERNLAPRRDSKLPEE